MRGRKDIYIYICCNDPALCRAHVLLIDIKYAIVVNP